MAAVEITDKSFEGEALKADTPVICEFWAPWCGPCKIMGPIFDKVSEGFTGKVKFAKLNVDENPETAGKYNVMSIPTLLIFKDGEVVDQLVGLQNEESLSDKLKSLL